MTRRNILHKQARQSKRRDACERAKGGTDIASQDDQLVRSGAILEGRQNRQVFRTTSA